MYGSMIIISLLAPAAEGPAGLAPLPAPAAQSAEKAAIGRMLFFDFQLSGDGSLSCASCHDPRQAWSDGQPLSKAYPGTLHFRNALPIVNAGYKKVLYADGRITDLKDLVRDHITDAQFMNADGRLVIERLRQIPEYEEGFKKALGGEPSFGRILDAVATFVRTVSSTGDPLDRHLGGDQTALDAEAKKGLALFTGKAGCVKCHSGPLLSDERFHFLGVPENRSIFAEPLRHITFRRFFKTLGVDGYARLRADAGLYALTKREADRGKFRTASLREAGNRKAFMHNGAFRTLAQVIDFYDRGGGKSPELKPLHLSGPEKKQLVAFLAALVGPKSAVEPPPPVAFQPRALGKN